ncbi:TPA: hypothetical protein DIC20_01050 [Candidatus Dependentiae bacterium]|nr:MAG: Thioredoxin [candidate division TM6 bacterium GW2011_GWF2_36_131]KKQ03612.1 MAG: Thioredoxin [candidate division TM6 bacterium GW2011_GWE2_36_25]KKQ20111.1 MAG: Thioredoxin [candidate division TM6 bacterium GW2011_GWA2_36_9]HBR70654.1 hypothetical protein [Candidatus Dependentiae bacterium]HCU00274.1 hypothetical protein [Candidatus Dependentiae bacterium]
MKNLFLLLLLITQAKATEEPMQNLEFQEKIVILCNGETCTQATISRYEDKRDNAVIMDLIDKNKSRYPEITAEMLIPYFNHKIENFNHTGPTGLTVSFSLSYSTYVLRTAEKIVGFISYLINSAKEPTEITTANIVLFYIDSNYQQAATEELLNFTLREMSNKKASMVVLKISKNEEQQSIVEKMGFQDFNQQVKAQQQIMPKNASKEQQEAAAKNLDNSCFYMKVLAENLPKETTKPTPIESSLLNITKATYEQEVLNETKPVVVDVYADWCGPCRKFAPIFEKVAEANPNYKFVRFNCVETEKELAKELDIKALPTTLFIKNKKIVGRETGFMSQEVLQQKLIEYF